MKQTNLLSSIISLWRCLGERRHIQFIFLFILMLVSVIAETLSIGAIVPFLSALTNPEKLIQLDWFQPVLLLLDITSSEELLLPLTLAFVGTAIFAAFIRILLLWVNTRLTASMGIQLRSEVFARTLFQPYEYHLEHNSSQLISMTTEKVGLAIQAGILHVLMFMNALVTSIAIIGILVLINPMVAMLTFLVLGGGYLFMGLLVRKNIRKNGISIAENQPESVKYMQEGLGGIRDIIMDGTQQVFINLYTKVASKIQISEMRNSFLGNLPKSLLEVMSITFIAILAYYLQSGTGKELQVLPVLGALALGAQRLLPALQQMYFSWSRINAYQSIVVEVVEQLNQPLAHYSDRANITSMNFNNEIEFNDVVFKYKNSEDVVLNKINLIITKGTKVGFIGTTGSGKSTLLDMCMGLLSPSSGQLTVDGVKVDSTNLKEWQLNIAHVPQSIFLSDASIAENIAFGISINHIYMVRVKLASKLAFLHDFIEKQPNGYKTTVGERGVQLSGGQRQRIGIARALYKQANILVFDEATSALDNKTETKVMQAIGSLENNLTVLLIAHRLSTLKKCDVIYKLENGNIVDSGNFKKMVK